MALWDKAVRGNTDPATIGVGSSELLHWRCPEDGYTWEARPKAITRSWLKGFSGCPKCAGKAPKTDADYHELAARRGYQWLGPGVVRVIHKTQWRCTNGHEWASCYNDISHGYGCPVCAGKVVTAENSLRAVHPDVAAEWHPTKNGSLTPNNVQRSSHKSVWWHCKACLSDWQMSVNMRDNGQGCPYCAGRRVNKTNSLAARHPELIAQWHPTKNGGLTPGTVAWCSGRKVWWRCQYGHEWHSRIANRVSQGGRGCPFCSNQTSRAELRVLAELRQIIPSVEARSKVRGYEVDLLLPECGVAIELDGHRWHQFQGAKDEEKANSLRKAGIRLIRLREEPLPLIFDDDLPLPRNFDSDPLPTLTSLAIKIASLTKGKSRAALKAYVSHSKLVGEREYRILLVERPAPESKKSLGNAYPEIAAEWNIELNAPLMPEMVTPGSHHKTWWNCPRGHEPYQTTILARTNGGNGCPTCAGKRIDDTNSFASKFPELVAEWHSTKNGALRPNEVAAFSGKRVWWRCAKGHEWQAPISSRSVGHGCSRCALANRRPLVVPRERSLAAKHPTVAKEWHPAKNGSERPDHTAPSTARKVWWKCANGHEWRASISNRANGAGCPTCYKERRSLGTKSRSRDKTAG